MPSYFFSCDPCALPAFLLGVNGRGTLTDKTWQEKCSCCPRPLPRLHLHLPLSLACLCSSLGRQPAAAWWAPVDARGRKLELACALSLPSIQAAAPTLHVLFQIGKKLQLKPYLHALKDYNSLSRSSIITIRAVPAPTRAAGSAVEAQELPGVDGQGPRHAGAAGEVNLPPRVPRALGPAWAR
jgi:hypothetical protein